MNTVTYPVVVLSLNSDLTIVALSFAAEQKALTPKNGFSLISFMHTETRFPTLFLAVHSMIGGRRPQDYVNQSVRDSPAR